MASPEIKLLHHMGEFMSPNDCLRRFFSIILISLALFAAPSAHAVSHGGKLRIGISVPTLDNPFWERYATFARAIADQLEIDIEILDFQTNEHRQLRDIARLIARPVDGLIITPQTVNVGPALITRAQKAGIPLVVTDRWPGIDPRAYSWDGYVGFIGPDDRDAGYRIGRTLIKDLGKRRFIALNGVHGASVAEGRFSGLSRALGEFPEAKLLKVNWVGETQEHGNNSMAHALKKFGDSIDGVWCYNDSLALGAMQAIRSGDSAGGKVPGNISVVGMDLVPDALEKIETGEYAASFGGHWMQGGFGLIMLYDFLNGYQPKSQYKVVKLKLIKVTRDNLALFRKQFIDTPPNFDAQAASMALNPEATGKYFFEISLQ